MHTPQQQDLIKLAEAGGNDKDLLFLAKLNRIGDPLKGDSPTTMV